MTNLEIGEVRGLCMHVYEKRNIFKTCLGNILSEQYIYLNGN